jgi:choline dehydrogenase
VPRSQTPLEADLVVVGAGTSGAIVAARAAESGRSVLLLEAGPDFPSEDSTPGVIRYGAYSEGTVTTRDFSWHWATALTAEDGEPYTLFSGRITGGGSSVNGQVWLHGLPGDFDELWAGRGAGEWNWAAVAPWYARTENDLDFPGEVARGDIPVRRIPEQAWHPLHATFVRVGRDRGLAACDDFNAPGAEGVGAQPFNNVDGVRLSTAFTHLGPARALPELQVLGDHMVDRILFEDGRATGVSVRTPDGESVTATAGQVVLAAGAIATPWLLMRSGIGDSAQLRRHGIPVVTDLPAVGTGLREHPQLALRWRARPGSSLDLTSARSPVAIRMTAPGSAIRDDIKISIAAFRDDEEFGVQVSIFLMMALSSGSVTLSDEGPGAAPQVDIHFLEHPEDRRRLRETVRYAVHLVEGSALADFAGERLSPRDDELADDDALDGWLRRTVQGTFHPSSTCAIGAVVDQRGSVEGVEALRIVDASTMPESVRANLNATVSMMGERFAAMLIDDLTQSRRSAVV